MRLTCPTCSHAWEEKVRPGAHHVICPECLESVPVSSQPEAGGADETRRLNVGTSAAAGALPVSPKPPSIHEMETVLGDDSHAPFHDGQTVKVESAPTITRQGLPPEATRAEDTRRLQSLPEAPTGPTAKPPQPTPTPPSSKRGTGTQTRAERLREYESLIGRALDGYRLEKLLGAGGMGAVYLAHQNSLDRKVAVKILPPQFAANFDLVARFTREALSAAQLSHHNVVQVYDVGIADGTHYIVMEYVRGESLAQIIKRDGPLRVDDAAGYVLQAARGLHYAHERGIIHRDIKPDNLMLNEHGIVKIADMGLAKMRSVAEENRTTADTDALHARGTDGDLTQADVALGTPAYMSPEQARDTSTVDSRADQYSLGCTLYYLCAGKAPYSGTTAFELMSKHMKEPLIPLETHVRGVPPAFSEIIKRMLAKNPDDRYPTLIDVAKTIESYLGIESADGQYKPREHHLATLEDCQRNYYAAAAVKHRKLAVMAYWLLMPVLIVLAFLSKSFALIGGSLALALLVPGACIVIDGIANKTYLYRRLRGALFGMNWKGWLKTIGAALAVCVFLVLTGWIWSWLGVLVLGAGVAAGYQALVLRRLRTQRRPAVERINEMFKELRLRGLSEEALQDFVARFTGTDWQEFFEEFFPYEDMVQARARMAGAEKVKARRKWSTWRDPIFRALDRLEEARRARRDKATLSRAEKDRLVAQGVAEDQAQEMAEQEATRILKSGLVLKAPTEDHKVVRTKRRLHLGKPLGILYRIARFAAGAAIVAAFLLSFAAGLGVTINLPPELASILSPSGYYGWGWGGSFFGLGAGLLLLISAFSGRIVGPTLVTGGALLLVLAQPVIAFVAQPMLNSMTLFWAAAAMVLVGFGFPLLAKLGGGKF